MNDINMKNNSDTYTAWVSDLKKKGKTPADMVAFVRSLGFEEYADRLEAFISEMQATVSTYS